MTWSRYPDGSLVRVRDVARVEMGSLNYAQEGAFNGKPAGKCSYTIEKIKDGEHIKSKLSYHLSPSANPTAQETQTSSRGRSSAGDTGLATDYLWKEVLTPSSLADIIENTGVEAVT